MVPTHGRWTWDIDSFGRAVEAAVFGQERVELLNGELHLAQPTTWQARVSAAVVAAAQSAYADNERWEPTCEPLPLPPNSAPRPDLWVRRRRPGATPPHPALRRHDPRTDALLVIEIADTAVADLVPELGVMAQLYVVAGIANYWVLCPEGVYVHLAPSAHGTYRERRLIPPDESVLWPDTHQLTQVSLLTG